MTTETTPTSASPRAAWRDAVRGNVLMMGLVSLFTDFSSEMMNPLLPIFIAGIVPLGWAPVYVGLIEGIAETTASLLKVFSGRISDRLGRRKVLVVIGYGLSTVCRPLTALVTAGWHIVGLKFLDRVGKGVRTSPRDALIGDSVAPGVRGLAFSFHRSMDHLGAVVGPLAVIGILYAFLGYARWGKTTGVSGAVPAEEMDAMRWLFAIALVPGLAAMICLLGKVREIAPKRAEIVPGAPPAPTVWRYLPKRFYAFVAVVTVFALGNSSDMFLLLYGHEVFHFDLQEIVLLWIVLHVSKVVFSLPGGAISDRVGRRPVIVVGWIVYAMVYLGMAVLDPGQPWQFWALFLVYGFYYGMSEGAEKALVTDFVSSEHRGTAFGIYHGAVGLAAMPASLLFGVFWKQIGPQWAFGIGAGLAGLAAVLLIALLSTRRAGPEPG
jgi:MFS family permease